MTVIDLRPEAHTHRNDPDTAKAAALAAMHPAAATPAILSVLSVHRAHRGGLTDDELMRLLPELGHTAKARASTLRKAGFLDDTGTRRPTRKGRNAVVWFLTGKGDDWCRAFDVPTWAGARRLELASDRAVDSATVARLMGECPLCGGQFTGRPGLSRHLRTTHRAVT